jgi:hypothetical protein
LRNDVIYPIMLPTLDYILMAYNVTQLMESHDTWC